MSLHTPPNFIHIMLSSHDTFICHIDIVYFLPSYESLFHHISYKCHAPTWKPHFCYNIAFPYVSSPLGHASCPRSSQAQNVGHKHHLICTSSILIYLHEQPLCNPKYNSSKQFSTPMNVFMCHYKPILTSTHISSIPLFPWIIPHATPKSPIHVITT